MWEPLYQEHLKNKKNKMIKEWVDGMTDRHGELDKWPSLGCRCKFFPWAKGASMVVELKLDDDTWTAIMAERMPSTLDNAIKGHHAKFYMSIGKLSPETLFEKIPIGFPMTHQVKGFPGIALYPVEEFERHGELMITEVGWCKMAMKVAENDMEHLEGVFTVAKKILIKLKENPDAERKTWEEEFTPSCVTRGVPDTQRSSSSRCKR